MFEKYTFDFLMERMMGRVSSGLDKREASIVYDALAPCAMELANFYIFLDMVLDETFADKASYEYLARRAAERGILPRLATNAILRAEFKPDGVFIPEGARFNLGVLNYAVTEKRDDGSYCVMCETEGTEGNRHFGKISPIEHVSGLQYGEITELLIPGEDDEDVEVFRNRYFSSFNSEAFGGNKADYIDKVTKIQGVGGAKVYRAMFGGGTVGIVIIDSEFNAPSQALIDDVRNKIDPPGFEGDGLGTASIDHVVTIMGVKPESVDITVNAVLSDNLSIEDIRQSIEEEVDAYFKELASSWADGATITVRISRIETRLLDIAGVLDIYDTELNGKRQNLTLPSDSIPVRGNIFYGQSV